MKKISLITLLSLAIGLLTAPLSGSYALENRQNLSLEMAIQTAIDQNMDLKLSEEKLKLAERNLKTALNNVDFYIKADWSSGAERQSNAKDAYLAPIQKQNQVNSLKRDIETQKADLQIKVLDQYYGIVKIQDDIKGKQSQLKVAEKNIENRKAEYKLGKATLLDVAKSETILSEEKNTIAELENDLVIAYLNFNNTLDETYDSSYSLTSKFPTSVKLVVTDMTAAIANEKVTNAKLASAKEKVIELEKEIEVVANYSSSHYVNDSSASTDTSDLELTLKSAKHNVAMTEMQLGYQFRIDYNSLLNVFDQLSIAHINVSLSEKSLAVAKARWSTGTSDLSSYLTAVSDLDTQKNLLAQKQLEYQLLLSKFKLNHKL